MSMVVFITASPRVPATGAVKTVRLAGGGRHKPYRHPVTNEQHRAGVAKLPRFRASLDFDEDGWTGGTIPQTGKIQFRPAQVSLLNELTALYWPDASILIEAGPEDGALAILLTGTVAAITTDHRGLEIEVADLSAALDKPLVTGRFAGTGGIEGGAEATGRIKRRSWGRVFNVEGLVLDKTNNVYEFGDPAIALNGWTALRDMGRGGAFTVLPWQGSAAATLAALKASAPAEGGGIVAPSIACAKWWTQPVGPLTADLVGEVGEGYVDTAPEIAARVSAAAGGPAVSNAAATAAIRSEPAGLHLADPNETAAAALDRLLLGVSLLWVLQPAGTIELRAWTFEGPVAELQSRGVRRLKSLRPMKARRVGYQKSQRIHSDGEIAAVLQIEDIDLLAPIVEKVGTIAEGATKNREFRQTTDPALNPANGVVNGDAWTDISTSPQQRKIRVGGTWQTSSNYVTGTNQLVDNAGLGEKAIWGGPYITGIPPELEDGRVAAGLSEDGDVARPIPGPVKAASDILSRAGGGTYSGDLGATRNDPSRSINRGHDFSSWEGTTCIGWPTGFGSGNVTRRAAVSFSRRGPDTAQLLANGGTMSERFSVTPGETLWLDYCKNSEFNRSGGASPTWYVSIVFYTATGAFVSETLLENAAQSSAAGSIESVKSAIVPSGAKLAALYVHFDVGQAASGAIGILDYFGAYRTEPGAEVTTGKPIDILADGTTYARVKGTELTSGVPKLSIAGSGKQIGDQRNLKPIGAMNLSYRFTGSITYSAAAGTPATATISVSAGSALIGSAAVVYNAMSVGVTGTAGTTVRFYLYVDDGGFAGGTRTLVATTDANANFQSDDRVWIGLVDVVFPAAGTGGGGGVGGGGGGGGGYGDVEG